MATGMEGAKYTYTPLADVHEGAVINVYGVVKWLRKPVKTLNDYSLLTLNIVDENLYSCGKDGLTCFLFMQTMEELPKTLEIGDIVRFHRMKIKAYNGSLQGKTYTGFSWVVIKGQEKEHSHSKCTFTKYDEDRILELQNWVSDIKKSGINFIKTEKRLLSEIVSNEEEWISIVAQVVSVHKSVNDASCVFIRIWDATQPKFKSHNNCTKGMALVYPPNDLIEIAEGRILDLHVYDNNKDKALSLQPGQFIFVTNVHTKRVKVNRQQQTDSTEQQSDDGDQLVSLMIHGNFIDLDEIQVLPDDDPEIVTLKTRTDALIAKNNISKDLKNHKNESCPSVSSDPKPNPDQIHEEACKENETTTVNQNEPITKHKDDLETENEDHILENVPAVTIKPNENSQLCERRDTRNYENKETEQIDVNNISSVDAIKNTNEQTVDGIVNKKIEYSLKRKNCLSPVEQKTDAQDFAVHVSCDRSSSKNLKYSANEDIDLPHVRNYFTQHNFSFTKSVCENYFTSKLKGSLNSCDKEQPADSGNGESIVTGMKHSPMHKDKTNNKQTKSTTLAPSPSCNNKSDQRYNYYTDISDVLSCEKVPSKFKCRVHVINYGSNNVFDNIYAVCGQCKMKTCLSDIPEACELDEVEIECGTCGNINSIKYILNLRVQDNTGGLEVELSDEKVTALFHGISTAEVRMNKEAQRKINTALQNMSKKCDMDKEMVGCLIESYYARTTDDQIVTSYNVSELKLPACYLANT